MKIFFFVVAFGKFSRQWRVRDHVCVVQKGRTLIREIIYLFWQTNWKLFMCGKHCAEVFLRIKQHFHIIIWYISFGYQHILCWIFVFRFLLLKKYDFSYYFKNMISFYRNIINCIRITFNIFTIDLYLGLIMTKMSCFTEHGRKNISFKDSISDLTLFPTERLLCSKMSDKNETTNVVQTRFRINQYAT